MPLTWTKIPMPGVSPTAYSGYQATGASRRHYSILKHGTRFRLAGGGGHADQRVATLAVLKDVCEQIEASVVSGMIGLNTHDNEVPLLTSVTKRDVSERKGDVPPAGYVIPELKVSGITAANPFGTDDEPNEPTPLEACDFPLGSQQNPFPKGENGPDPSQGSSVPSESALSAGASSASAATVPVTAVTEFPVTTCGGTLLIAATSQAEAERIAVQDGYMVKLTTDTDDTEGENGSDPTVSPKTSSTPVTTSDGEDGSSTTPVPPAPTIDPEPGLDTVVPEFRPGTPPAPESVPEPAEHPDHETPLAAPDAAPDLGVTDARFRASIDRDSLVNTLSRLVMRRDLSWRPGAVIAPVRRYFGGRKLRA